MFNAKGIRPIDCDNLHVLLHQVFENWKIVNFSSKIVNRESQRSVSRRVTVSLSSKDYLPCTIFPQAVAI